MLYNTIKGKKATTLPLIYIDNKLMSYLFFTRFYDGLLSCDGTQPSSWLIPIHAIP